MSATTKKQDEAKLPAVIDVSKYAIMGDGNREFMATVKENIGEVTEKTFARVRIPKGDSTIWQLDGELVPYWDGVIVYHTGAGAPRSYWSQAYKGGHTPPDCRSQDGVTGVGNPGGDCKSCPHAQWGTKRMPDGSPGPGQACGVKRLIFVYRQTDILPVILIVPPGSAKAYDAYMRDLTVRNQRAKHTVVTRFGLVQATNAGGIQYAQLQPSCVKLLSNEEASRIAAMAHEILADIATAASRMAEDADVMADAAV